MRKYRRTRTKNSGVTLVELLVVAAIIITLATVSVPTIKPMMESRVTSHGASVVSTYLNRAKSRAMTTGRSCGVTFEYFPNTWLGEGELGSASLVMRQIEVPPPYCGLDVDDRITLDIDPAYQVVADPRSQYFGRKVARIVNFPYGWADYVVNQQDPQIQFNSTGAWYPLYCDAGGSYVVALPGSETPILENASFKVRRDPRSTMTAPAGMPQGAVVDLEFSGTDSTFFTRGSDVTVMFAPTGAIDYVVTGGEKLIPSDTLYFLIGRWDRISALGYDADRRNTSAEDGLWNFEDGNNFWVSINPQTGLVSTAEVASPQGYVLGDLEEGARESREYARTSKRNLGGH